MAEMTSKFDLPGFRFHPTEEELLDFYLKRMVFGKKMSCSTTNVIKYLSIYQHDPWDLPGLAKVGEREWYFYVPRERKHGSMGRPSRTTEHGFWKATGSDRKIVSLSEPKRVVGMRKTLVFYKGRAPRGCKTDWVMNEYRLPDSCALPMDIVLCKIYRKATSMKVLEQRAAAMEEEKKAINYNIATPTSPSSSSLCSTSHEDPAPLLFPQVDFKKELEGMELTEEDDHTNNNNNNNGINRDEKAKEIKGSSSSSSSLQWPMGQEKLPELQVPTSGLDWNQYNIWLSPNWLLNFTAYNNLLNL